MTLQEERSITIDLLEKEIFRLQLQSEIFADNSKKMHSHAKICWDALQAERDLHNVQIKSLNEQIKNLQEVNDKMQKRVKICEDIAYTKLSSKMAKDKIIIRLLKRIK